MNIYYYADPDYADSHWCIKCISAIQTAASKRKYRLIRVADCEPAEVLAVIENKREPLIVIGAVRSRMAPVIERLSGTGIRLLMLNCMPEHAREGVSAVVVDYGVGVYRAVQYMRQALDAQQRQDKRIALFGMNMDSLTDILLPEAFFRAGGREEDIFRNDGNLDAACAEFVRRSDEFGGVICVCDIVALALRSYLKGKMSIPEDMMLISFADVLDTVRGTAVKKLGITTIHDDYEQMACNAVYLARYIAGIEEPLSITVKIVPQITPSTSTGGFIPCDGRDDTPVMQYDGMAPGTTPKDFFGDDVVQDVNDFCRCMYMISQNDEIMIRMLIGGASRAAIAEKLHISESTLYERIRMLCRHANRRSTRELTELMEKYL